MLVCARQPTAATMPIPRPDTTGSTVDPPPVHGGHRRVDAGLGAGRCGRRVVDPARTLRVSTGVGLAVTAGRLGDRGPDRAGRGADARTGTLPRPGARRCAAQPPTQTILCQRVLAYRVAWPQTRPWNAPIPPVPERLERPDRLIVRPISPLIRGS
jgi:hypothetical protein